jgi:hypothetical protein
MSLRAALSEETPSILPIQFDWRTHGKMLPVWRRHRIACRWSAEVADVALYNMNNTRSAWIFFPALIASRSVCTILNPSSQNEIVKYPVERAAALFPYMRKLDAV